MVNSFAEDFPYRIVEPAAGYEVKEGDKDLEITIERICDTSCNGLNHTVCKFNMMNIYIFYFE